MTRSCSVLLIVLAVSACPAATVSSLTLSASGNPIQKGTTVTLTCQAHYSDGTSGPCVAPAYTETESGGVIRISGNSVFGYSVGSAIITATVSGVSTTLAVNVSPPSQEALGIITANQVANGLGFNVNPANDWEFNMAAAAGATFARFQCGWSTLESQTPPPQNTNQSTRYALQPYCQSAYTSALKYRLHPIIVAGYGPPYHAIVDVTVPGGAPAGATSISVQLSSGQGGDTLYSLRAFYDAIIRSDGTQITTTHSYPGALITAVSVADSQDATLMLSSKLSSPLPAGGTLYTVNELLYPPAATTGSGDPSVYLFVQYAQFVAQSLAAAGLSGQVELWNEPPWPDDRWDVQANSYDVFPGPGNPGPKSAYLPNWGFVGALQSTRPPNGVSYVWAGTEKSGGNSVLDPQMQMNTGITFAEPAVSILSESFHPYGNSPEDGLWIEPCFANTTGSNDFYSCNLFGVAGGNFSLAAQEDYLLKKSNPSYGLSRSITETGFSLDSGDTTHQARFVMRQFLGYQAAGVSPITFYRLFDTSSEQLTFLDSSENPLPAYTAIFGFMADVAKIANPPVRAYSGSTLPSIKSYGGTFPLDFVHIVGSRAGDSSNSDILAVWQRSYTTGGSSWAAMPQPASASVSISIPTGLRVAQVVDLVTRAKVSYTLSNQQLVFAVSDDAIEVLVTP
jgi:hypothetical protein